LKENVKPLSGNHFSFIGCRFAWLQRAMYFATICGIHQLKMDHVEPLPALCLKCKMTNYERAATKSCFVLTSTREISPETSSNCMAS
jgi:hypothetical protein